MLQQFKFHCDSINMRALSNIEDEISHLNSTVILLIWNMCGWMSHH